MVLGRLSPQLFIHKMHFYSSIAFYYFLLGKETHIYIYKHEQGRKRPLIRSNRRKRERKREREEEREEEIERKRETARMLILKRNGDRGWDRRRISPISV